MKRKRAILLALLVRLAGFLGGLALRNRQPPLLPEDERHRSAVRPEGCLV